MQFINANYKQITIQKHHKKFLVILNPTSSHNHRHSEAIFKNGYHSKFQHPWSVILP